MSHLIDDVILSEPGNINPRRIAVAAPQLSWELSAPGSFSGFVRLDALQEADLAGDIRGMWLTYSSAAGAWGGVVIGRPTTDGVAEIVAEGFASLLRGKVIAGSSLTITGSAGGIAKRVIHESGAFSPSLLEIGTVDEGGGSVSLDITGDVGADVLPQIAEVGDVEWQVDADRVFTLARKLGSDKSMTIRMVEDRHIIGVRVADDIETTARGATFRVQSGLSLTVSAFSLSQTSSAVLQPPNNPEVIAPPSPLVAPWWQPIQAGDVTFSTDTWEALPEGVPVGGSIPANARRRVERVVWQTYRIDSPGVVSIPGDAATPPPWSAVPLGVGANNPSVPSTRFAPVPTTPAELTLANADNLFTRFDLGDTVRIEVGSVGVCGRFRLRSKALDVASNSLTVSGDLLRDA